MFSILLAASLVPAADTDKVPAEIKGEWGLTVVVDAKSFATSTGEGKFTISDKEAEGWILPNLIKKKVKGTIKVDSSKKPARIELKVGDDVYRGVFRYSKTKDAKDRDGEALTIFWNEAGGDFPSDLPKEFKIPKDFKGVLMTGERKVK
jgi:hypothetical protein